MHAYYPEADNWERIPPKDAGFDAHKLAGALDFAGTQEIDASRNLADVL